MSDIQKDKTDFSVGKVSTLVIRLGVPMMVAELVHVLYNLVDRMFIGHMEGTGTAALTGVGVVFPLVTLISAFANLFGVGGAPLAAIARGERDNGKAERIMETSLTLLLLVGTVLTIVLYVFAEPLLTLLGGDEETLPFAMQYFRIYVIGTIPVMLSLGMNPFINSMGYAKIGMVTVAMGAALNTALDPLFIYAFDMGIRGAAIATVVSQTASAAWATVFLCGKKPVTRIRRLRVNGSSAWNIIKLGVTGFCFKVTNSITQAAMNITLKAWGGAASTLYVGAISIIRSIQEVGSLPGMGLVNGAQPVMSFNYGAKKNGRTVDTIRFALFAALGIQVFSWVLILGLRIPLIRIFTEDAALIEVTEKCLLAYFFCFPLMTFQMVGQNVFVALNYPKKALIFSLLRKVFLILPLTLLLPGWGLGVMGPYWAEPISEIVGSAACFLTMYFTLWKPLRRTPDGVDVRKEK